jgi:micrococcal nuclease
MYDLYVYKALITKVYDGDTVTADIDLGMGIWFRGQKIRLEGIDAPEVRGEEREYGLISRDWLRDKVLNKEVIIRTTKDKKGKYGRWIGEIWTNNEGMYENINALLVSLGMAEEAEY